MPHKWKPKTLTCHECGRDYTAVHPQRTRRFCSKSCGVKASMRVRTAGHRVERTCEVCGARFSVQLCWKDAKYCSRACYRKRPTRYSRTFKCARCGAEVSRKQGYYRASARFCSTRCRGLDQRKAVSYITGQGYRQVYIDAKPILEHRYVMEKALGRPLLTAESVHHRNGDRLDNAPENLELWDRSQPAGQRVEDKLAWCREFLGRHGLAVVATHLLAHVPMEPL